MNTSYDQSEMERAIEHCAAERVHVIGSIQPHGALIAVDPETLLITHASDNTARFFRLPIEKVLGAHLNDVFGRSVKHTLVNAMAFSGEEKSAHDIGQVHVAGETYFASSCLSPSGVIFEFERKPERTPILSATTNDLEFLIEQTRNVDDQQALFEKSVQLLHMMTGYDRVMVYQFDAEKNGHVFAEALSPGIEPFLGLRFPAFDIPAQARQIMAKTAMRYIADVEASDIPIRARDQVSSELNITNAHLRSASQVHLQYLRNMGTQATFTLNINLHGEIWGMISFHHSQPRYPDPQVRQIARNFAAIFSLKLELLDQTARSDRLKRADDLRKSIAEKAENDGLHAVFEGSLLSDLRDIMEADGAALIQSGQLNTSGEVPSAACIDAIATHPDLQKGVTSTVEVTKTHPDIAANCAPGLAGFMVAQLPEQCTFLFFRKDRAQQVTWAGAPDKAIKRENGVLRLTPRQSFAAFAKEVVGTSSPWTVEQHHIAEELWSILVAVERDALIRRTNRQQTLLIDELNHRVRNILALIRSLSQQSLSHNGSIMSYVTALKSRIAAVASAHDLGAEKSKVSATIRRVLELEAAPYNQEQIRVRILGPDCGLRPDLTPMFALVFHEMMTNAVKYGALSNEFGTLVISITKTETEVTLEWLETGGPRVALPVRKGFGTTLIETSVPHELHGSVSIEHRPTGVFARVMLPKGILYDKVSLSSTQSQPSGPSQVSAPVDVSDLVSRDCLLVEDNYVVSLDTSRVLGLVGFKAVTTALTAEDALSKIELRMPGFAVLDVNLAEGETSVRVAEVLKAANVPIVFVTGYGDTEALGPGYEEAIVLKKPLREDELRNVLARMAA